MKYNFNGKMLNIPDGDIQHSIKAYSITEDEAIQLWLEDNNFLDNEEVEELTAKAKVNKVSHDAHSVKAKNSAEKRERKKNTSSEKVKLFADIVENLKEIYENVEIATENKLIFVQIGNKKFKIDVIETRNK